MKKSFTVFISIVLVLVMTLSMTACQIPPITDGGNTENNGSSTVDDNKLQILKTDTTLTQDQVLSQIKADKIKTNNGYKNSDEITVMISLNGESLIDAYNNRAYLSNQSVVEYASTTKGNNQLKSLKDNQDRVISQLKAKKLIGEVNYTYSTIFNGFSTTVKYGDISKIENNSAVKSVIIADTYNRPQTVAGSGSAVENIVDVYETGIFDSSSVNYTGKNTSVAILDSGFDLSHSVFANVPDEQMLSKAYIDSILGTTKAAEYSQGLEVSQVYNNGGKVPFAYDYADKDADVFPYDSSHGTHVAGIIGGKDDVITGVAVDTQLVLMKVFPDLDDGAPEDALLSALEDSVLIGVDAINMSLGSSCGFSREIDQDNINRIYDSITQAGISLITAASNSYSSGFGGEQGNTNMVTNPDSGTVGSPSTYGASLSVASIDGVKSRYIMANDSQVIFFTESNAITGEPNDFVAELGIPQTGTVEYQYVTVPGSGLRVNYASIDVKGKIALVRRGDNTFEEKALNAKNAGAIACIIYNNIDGDILMSMGKTDHIPTISISKSDGYILAQKATGTMTLSYDYSAGPFMSDFSSWGPTPSLELKPEITAHGGNITSSVPGGKYDQVSGTSMASPNLCGIVVLIRQYLKNQFPDKSPREIAVLTGQMLMSTATIVNNQQGNPYSPRKQGAGLASLKNVVNTKAYLSVDNLDRAKLQLGDDADRTGMYKMSFNIVNISDSQLQYDLSVIGMTESVSSSDTDHVAEMSQLLNGSHSVTVGNNGKLSGNIVTVPAQATVSVEVVYTLTNADKELIDSLFPYGMYVEGFVKLSDLQEDGVDLNIPFLAFYGDWTQAPLFDKTYYEVESEAHDMAIDEEDKLKADYYATTPYGSYFYNYIIPLGTYLYDIDTSKYDAIPASLEHIALSNVLGTIDGISSIYGGLLRNAQTMHYTITDKLTGELVFDFTDNNARKAYSLGGSPIPYYYYLNEKSADMKLVNNRQYEFKMMALLDYGDGGADTNMRNSFAFDFYMDDEAPIIKEATYDKVYDKTLKEDRYYINLTVYDNHYVQSISPVIFTSNSSYAVLTDNPIPVYSERNSNTTVRFEITQYLKDIQEDSLINNALAFSIDDYALNSNIFVCQLPGTRGDFKFTDDGEIDGDDLIFLNVYENEVVDLTRYLATTDSTVDVDKDYLKYLSWTSSNTDIVAVENGLLIAKTKGRATVTCVERLDGKQAILIINVKQRATASATAMSVTSDDYTQDNIKSIRLSHFVTQHAYARAGQRSEIGDTGDKMFLSSMSSVAFYPGESIQLFYDVEPWYVKDKYTFEFQSSNTDVATVSQDGVVVGWKEGSANIVVTVNGSRLVATLRITIKNPFIVEDRTLVAYKGLGGAVVIPDDEGIITIGSYAFCLFETDNSKPLPEDDFDANKIPSSNRQITSVVIPDGVETIDKYAFFNCYALESVTLPDTVLYIRDYAFANNEALNSINFDNTETIGRNAFAYCAALQNVDLSRVLTIGEQAFYHSGLVSANLTSLRNTGARAFSNCPNLTTVVLAEQTKLSEAMFAISGLTSVDIYNSDIILPNNIFARCVDLTRVTLHNDIVAVGFGSFSGCTGLSQFESKAIERIGEQAFYQCTSLESLTLPNNVVSINNHAFYRSSGLTTLVFQANTQLQSVNAAVFKDTALTTFSVDAANQYYTTNGNLLLTKDGKTVLLAAISHNYGDYTLDASIENIANGAFSGANINSIATQGNIAIDDYAFYDCSNLTTVTLAAGSQATIGQYAFNSCTQLTTVNNLDTATAIGDYAFASTGIAQVDIGDNVEVGEGAFLRSAVTTVNLGQGVQLGVGVFQNCSALTTVNMPEGGNVHIGRGVFGNCTKLTTIDLTKTDDTIEAEAFYGCTSLASANLANVKHLGNYAFSDCSALSSVQVPVIVTIGDGAFSQNATSATAPIFASISLPDTLTSIGDGAFLACRGLISIVIPQQITRIADFTFSYCVSLNSVELPSGLTDIGRYAFAGCERLSSINTADVLSMGELSFANTLSLTTLNLDSVRTIGEGAFSMSALTGNIVANSLVTVDNYAFQNANLTTFRADNLESIGEAAFQLNARLQQVTLSNKLAYVGPMAFNECRSLTTFLTPLGSTTGEINNYAKLRDGVLYTKLATGYYQLSSVPSALNIKTLVVPEGVQYVQLYAGNANTNITRIVLPDSMKNIAAYAFFGYTNLVSVEFKSVKAPALESFYDNRLSLSSDDPGYELLKGQYDMFGYTACYTNFINLVGKQKPIEMILPENSNIVGYDSLIYQVYFGKVEDATRSTYQATEQAIIDFYEYSGKIMTEPFISLNHEDMVNSAIAALRQVTQDYTEYGYDKTDWDARVDAVNAAKARINQIKFDNGSEALKATQTAIDALPDIFSLELLPTLQQIYSQMASLTAEERMILDLTNYNLLQQQYNQYREIIAEEVKPIQQSYSVNKVAVALTVALSSFAVALIGKKIIVGGNK